jgi:hypothetical protein
MIQEPWEILDLQKFPKLARVGTRRLLNILTIESFGLAVD